MGLVYDKGTASRVSDWSVSKSVTEIPHGIHACMSSCVHFDDIQIFTTRFLRYDSGQRCFTTPRWSRKYESVTIPFLELFLEASDQGFIPNYLVKVFRPV